MDRRYGITKEFSEEAVKRARFGLFLYTAKQALRDLHAVLVRDKAIPRSVRIVVEAEVPQGADPLPAPLG